MENKPKRIIHTLFLLDFCFDGQGKIKKDDNGNLDFKSSNLNATLEKVQKELDEGEIVEKEIDNKNIELDERLFEKIKVLVEEKLKNEIKYKKALDTRTKEIAQLTREELKGMPKK